MNLLGILTLIAVTLIVLALASYLIVVMVLLRKTLLTLGTVNVGLRAIAERVEPLESIVGEINSDLSGVRDAVINLLERHAASPEKEAAS